MSDLEVIISFVVEVAKAGGPYAMLGVLLTGLLKIYRLELIQRFLPAKLRWDQLPPFAKVALPFGLALLGVGLPAYLLGSMGLVAALVAGVSAGLTAIGLHHGIKESKPVVVDRTDSALPVGKQALMEKLLNKKP